MQRGRVLLDIGKPPDLHFKNIIRLVVVDGGDLSDQQIRALASEGVPVCGLVPNDPRGSYTAGRNMINSETRRHVSI